MHILSNGRIRSALNPQTKLDVNGSINISQGSSFYIDNHKFISVDLSKQNIFLGTGNFQNVEV